MLDVLALVFVMNFVVFAIICGCVRSSSFDPVEEEPIRRYIEPITVNLTQWESFIVAAQEVEDEENDIHAPAIEDIDGPLLEYTTVGMLELGEIIHTGHESVIFEVINRPEFLVKYQVNCDELSDGTGKPIHPLVYDYWMMREASMIGLAPEPIFLSPAALLVDVYGIVTNRKFPFTMSSGDFLECLANEGAVRYMVMERSAGENLHRYKRRYPYRVVPMLNASEITIKVIQALEQLHEDAGIFHGDIHSGNILIEQGSDGEVDNFKIQLIDFGRARRVDPNMTNDRIFEVGKWFHQLCSPWQIDGRAWSRRDDIYKTIHVFATLINPPEYDVREAAFLQMNDPRTAVGIKRDANIFVMAPPVMVEDKYFSSRFHPLLFATRKIPARMIQVSKHLEEIQNCITEQLDDINGVIPYGKIVANLRAVIDLVR